jgi:hypothetical protein
LRNTARIIGDFSKGQTGKGIGDIIQTLGATRVLSGNMRAFRGLSAGTGVANALQQASFKSQYDAMQNTVLKSLAESNLGKKLFPGMSSAGKMAGPTGSMYTPGYLGGVGFFNYAGRLTQNVTNQSGLMRGIGAGLTTPFAPGGAGGFLGGNMNLLRVGAVAGGIGILATAIGTLVQYMKMLSTAVLQGAQAMAGFVRMAVVQAAEFQSIRSANVSGILGSQFGGVYNRSTLSSARNTSASQFAYMRQIAEKSVYTLPEIAGAANILTQNNIPLNKFLETTALSGQAIGLKGKNVEEVARIFARLSYGDFPDREIGAKYGLVATNPELKKLGFRFDKNNSMLNKPADAVNMTQQFLNKRFGSGFLVSANDFNTKFATLSDKFATILEKIGTPIMNSLIPVFETLGKVIDSFVQTGVFERLGGSIALFFDNLNTYLASPDFKNHSAFFFAVLEEIPNQLSNMFNFFGKMLTQLIGAAQEISKGGPWRLLGEALLNIGTLGAAGAAKVGAMAINAGILDFAAGQFAAPETIMLNYEKYKAMMAGPGSKGKKVTPLGEKPFDSDQLGKAAEEGNKKLQQLVDNSKKLVDLFDLRRQTIGLGPLSQIGVTGVELAAAGMPMINSHKIDPSNYNSISAGPVRGVNQLEKGINALNRENQNKAKAGRGIRTSR